MASGPGDHVRAAPAIRDPGSAGSPGADAPLVEHVYAQLHAIARRQMGHERAGHTLQATALVNEAYLRLTEAGVTWSQPALFYHAAAEAMRRILVEHARKRAAGKRGGDRARVEFDLGNVADLAGSDPDGIVALDEAIVRLQGADPRAASVVRLRFFAGLSVEGAAAALGLSDRTVKRDWEFARAWLHRAMSPAEDAAGSAGGEGGAKETL